MPHRIVSGLIGIILLTFCTGLCRAQNEEKVDLDSAVALVTVFAQADPDLPGEILISQGSGFLVDLKEGLIVTAKHVVDAKLELFKGKRRYMVSLGGHSGEVQAQKFGDCADGSTDICVLTIQAIDVQRAGVKAIFQPLCTTLHTDDPIMGLGFFPGDFSVVTRARGFITGPRSTDQKYPSDMGIVGGMSGGPVVSDGYVVALNAGGLKSNPSLTFVQALSHGFSMLEDAGIVCPRERPGPPRVISPSEDVSDLAVRSTPPLPASETPIARSPVDINLAAEADAATPQIASALSSPHVALPDCDPFTTSFSNVVGPDPEPTVYQLERTVGPTASCMIDSYELKLEGDAPVASLTVDQAPNGSFMTLDYAIWSETASQRKIKFSLSMKQQRAPYGEASSSVADIRPASLDQVLDWENSVVHSSPILLGSPAETVIAGEDVDIDFGPDSSDFSAIFGGDLFGAPSSVMRGNFGALTEIGTDNSVNLGNGLSQADDVLQDCLSKSVSIDRAVPPLGGTPQSAEFVDRVVADPGCQIIRLTVIGDDGVLTKVLPNGLAATVNYSVTSTADKAGRLQAAVVVEQYSPSTTILDFDAPPRVLADPSEMVEHAIDGVFDF